MYIAFNVVTFHMNLSASASKIKSFQSAVVSIRCPFCICRYKKLIYFETMEQLENPNRGFVMQNSGKASSFSALEVNIIYLFLLPSQLVSNNNVLF